MVIGIDASRANVLNRTGTEWYTWHVLRELFRQHPEQRFVLYVREALRPDMQNLLTPNTTVRVLRWPPRILWTQLRLSLELLVRSVDVLFVPAHTIPLIHPRATVTTIHDIGFELHPELYDQSGVAGVRGILGTVIGLLVRLITFGRYGNSELDYHRWSLRLALKHASHILTVSQHTAQALIERFSVAASHITVTHPGFELEALPTPSDVPTLPDSYLLFAGRLERKKNIAQLVRAYGLLQQHLPTAPVLVLVGKWGTGADEIQSAIQALPNPASVRVMPWLSRPSLEAIWRRATVFVFPSSYEGFGLPVIESFAYEVPVVCSTAGSLPEVAGDAAEFVDSNDAASIAAGIRRVLTEPTRRAELIAKGRLRFGQFRWADTAAKTFAVLQSAGVANKR